MDLTNLHNDRKRRKSQLDLSTMVYGKVPPQAKDLEEAVLGAIMLDREGYERAAELLRPDCFYVEAHQRIFNAMQSLSNKSQPIDILTVAEQLKSTEELELVGGSYYVTKLTNSVTGGAHIEHHCRIVFEKFIKREIIRIAGELIGDAYEDGGDAFELLDQAEQSLEQVNGHRTNSSIAPIDSVLIERVRRMHELRLQDQHITGVPSGFHHLDRITHGWQNTDLIILAARPSVGKTAMALRLARNAANMTMGAKKPRKVALFSLEMSKGQLVDRMISSECEIPLDKIQTGNLSDSEFKETIYKNAIQPLSKMGIYIDDTPALNIYQLRSKFRYMKRKFSEQGVEWVIIIDYLQLMSGIEDRNVKNREQEISNISRNLKKIAKEENIPVIALSQLSRNVENRAGEKKVPNLSDLRDSGAIEQDADMVMFLYRPEYYEVTNDAMGESTKGLTELSIAKHRNGSLAKGEEAIKLRALLHIQKFVDWDGAMFITPPASSGWRPISTGDKFDDDKDPF